LESKALHAICSFKHCLDYGIAEINKEYFSDNMNKKIFEIIKSMYVAEKTVSMMTVYQEMKSILSKNHTKWMVIDQAYCSKYEIEYIVGKLKENYKLRELHNLALNMSNRVIAGDNVDEIIKELQDKAYGIGSETEDTKIITPEERATSILTTISERMQQGSSGGIRTSYEKLNKAINGGFQPGELVILAAETGKGKAQPLYEKVLTPSGFVEIGSIKIGDEIIGDDGKVYNCTGVFPQGKKDVYKINFNCGSVVECCDEHLWNIQTYRERFLKQGFKTLSLKEIMKLPLIDNHHNNIYLPMIKPVEFKESKLPVDPYLLGVLIGDGCLNVVGSIKISLYEKDIREEIEKKVLKWGLKLMKEKGDCDDYRITCRKNGNKLKDVIRNLGLLGKSNSKFIPKEYLTSSIKQRMELLNGLIDTDGFVSSSSYEYVTVSKQLSNDVKFLAESIGATVYIGIKKEPKYTHNGEKRIGQVAYRVKIKMPNGVVAHSSKKHNKVYKEGQTQARRYIKSIEFYKKEECVCIKTSNPTELYITTDFIVTHNTAMAMNLARDISIIQKYPCLYVNTEMNEEQWDTRMAAILTKEHASLTYSNIATGNLAQCQFDAIVESLSTMSKSEFYSVTMPELNVENVISMTNRFKAQKNIKVLIVDYIGRMETNDPKLKEYQVMRDIAKKLKTLAQRLNITVIMLAQLNQDEKLEGAKAIKNEADLFMYLQEMNESNRKEFQDLYNYFLVIDKNRNGARGKLPLLFTGEKMLFTD
jgi:replicative DNA helicase